MEARPTIVTLPPLGGPTPTSSAPPATSVPTASQQQQGPTIVAIPPALPKKAPPPPPPEETGRDDEAAEISAALAAASVAPPEPETTTTTDNTTDEANYSVATLSSPWEFDDQSTNCTSCGVAFTPVNRKHHCRLCGKIFCHDCSNQRSLIPPSSIVLVPKGGKKISRSKHQLAQAANQVSFSPDDDPDRMLTYVRSGGGTTNGSSNGSNINIYNNNGHNMNNPHGHNNSGSAGGEELLYGKGLEERFKLAREPLRVCRKCYDKLEPIQEELRSSNSNAMRFNHIDPTDPRRHFNSPLAFTLGHEVRKAAYTLNNLLPLPRRMGAFMGTTAPASDPFGTTSPFGSTQNNCQAEMQTCRDECSGVSPNLQNVDGVQIPAKLLEQAKGIAVLTVAKGGFGLAGFEFGTGLVVARLGDNLWSAPSAIGTAGVSWGALIGAQVSDHVFLLMTDNAVEIMFSQNGSMQLGADIGVAVGPVGRALEADFGASGGGGNGNGTNSGGKIGTVAPIYTYSFSKGLYAGVSLDGKVIVTRARVNEKFYGKQISSREILMGAVPTPPAAQPLYEALTRCHVYANAQARNNQTTMQQQQQQQFPPQDQFHQQQQRQQQLYQQEMEYGEFPPVTTNSNTNFIPQQHEHQQIFPPADDDQHSYAGGFSAISDLTYQTGF